DDLTARNTFGNVLKRAYREIALQSRAVVRVDFQHTDLLCGKSLAEQAANQSGSHVAAADEANIHNRFPRNKLGLLINPVAKDGSADAHHSLSFGNRGGKIMRHAHR